MSGLPIPDVDLASLPPSRQAVHRLRKPRTWIAVWFVLSTCLVIWDAGYCLLRPRSMEGGDLHWIWKPYAFYGVVDHIYGWKSFDAKNGFTSAQALLNVIESILNLEYVYLAHVGKPDPSAPVVGFGAAVMTFSKTLLYWLQEYYCDYCCVGQNDFKTLVLFWIIPNGLWLVFPLLVLVTLGRDISHILTCYAADTAEAIKAAVSEAIVPSSIPHAKLVDRLEPLKDFIEAKQEEEAQLAEAEPESEEAAEEEPADEAENEEEGSEIHVSPAKPQATPVKRGRGRPRKSGVAPPTPQSVASTSSFQGESDSVETTPRTRGRASAAKRQTRSMSKQL